MSSKLKHARTGLEPRTLGRVHLNELVHFVEAMTSSKDMKAGSVLQSSGDDRRRPPLDQLPPPANSNKPLTPFSIEDILNKPSVKKSAASLCPPRVLDKVTGSNAARNGISTPSSPLCALEELASKTFKGLEVSVIQAAEGNTLRLLLLREGGGGSDK